MCKRGVDKRSRSDGTPELKGLAREVERKVCRLKGVKSVIQVSAESCRGPSMIKIPPRWPNRSTLLVWVSEPEFGKRALHVCTENVGAVRRLLAQQLIRAGYEVECQRA